MSAPSANPPAQPSDAFVQEAILPPGGPWSPPYRLLTLGLLITIVSAAFESLAVATIMPATANDLGGLSLYGWVFSSFMLANLVGITIAGGEADLRGPARPYVAGIVLFIIGLLIGGLAPAMIVLILGRTIQGLGAGLVSSVIYVAVGRGYPPEAKPRMLALMSSGWVIPGLIGPALAGIIADHIGWRWVFLGLIPICVGALFMSIRSLRVMPPGNLTARDTRRIRDAMQLAIGAGLLLAGPGQSNRIFGLLLSVVGAILIWPALRRLLPAGTVRARAGLPAAIASMILLNFGFFGVDAYIPLALTDVRGRSASFAGLALTAATITWSAGSWVQARYVRRVGRRRLERIGLALITIGSLGAILMLSESVSVIAGPLAWGIAGLGMGIAYSTLSLVVLETANKGEEGAATSSMQLGIVLATALATGLGGVLIDNFGSDGASVHRSILVQDILMVGVLIMALVVAGRLPGKEDSQLPIAG
ncbi:MAG TPA: MFS transporter [Thermomicrobiales bacterium]|nr:MFS transporter [Thermomicrobiales bacterium]